MLFGSPGSGRKLSTPTELRSVQAQRPMSWLSNELVLLRSAGCSGMLPLSATLCCHWRHSQCTIILPPGAIQPCHLIRSGLACQIQLSAAAKAIRDTIRRWKIPTYSNKAIEELSRLYNPMIRGWLQYYGRFYRTALRSIVRQLDRELVLWAKPELFAHWELARSVAP